ncbi:MAG: hypothetical protein IT310_00475 [Anaerolineales bacterium]|nr:hypothetical protein [Anaerolineales bacterium]
MSMEDILKVLVDSRQQGNAQQAGADPMASLIGGLLGGQPQSTDGAHAPINPNAGSGSSGMEVAANLIGSLLGGQSQPTGGAQTQNLGGGSGTDLSGMMGLLETFMGGQGNSSASMSNNDPIMALLTPFVAPLAKKANIPPQIAMIVLSFVVHKLLAHYPTSGRDSNSFDLDNMLGQMTSGKVDSNVLRQSGMINELSQKTGLDEAQTEQALQLAFASVGKTVSKISTARGASAKPASAGAKPKSLGGKKLGSAGAKAGPKK